MTLKTLVAKARKLPVRERAMLLDELWTTFSEEELALTDGWFNEADLHEWNRRSDELDKHPERVLNWEQMQKRPAK